MALLQIDNPPNPWSSSRVEWLGPPPTQPLEFYLDQSRSILAHNDSPDIPFRWSVNPYRGCFHGCAYCYARPTHEYLGMGAGTDFDRRLVIKPQAPALLTEAFERRGWAGELVVFSGNTDCYQPLEATHGLTRACLEVCLRYRNPVGIITKAPLIERDMDLLSRLSRETHLTVTVSVPFWDREQARAMEPAVPSPARRIETIRRLHEAGIPVGVNFAPVIPGLNDDQLVEVLERARAAGAQFAGAIMVRLPGPVAEVFEKRLRARLPLRAERVLKRIREMRGGGLNDPRFGARMRGEGPYAAAVKSLFEKTRRRLGYGPMPAPPDPSPFRRPPRAGDQLRLF